MATRYWIGTNSDWFDTANWSTSSGGAGGSSVPAISDDVIFDKNSSQGAVCNTTETIENLTIYGDYGVTFTGSIFSVRTEFKKYGSGELTVTGTGSIFIGTLTGGTHILAGNDFGNKVLIGATSTVNGDFSADTIDFTGTITLGGNTMTCRKGVEFTATITTETDTTLIMDSDQTMNGKRVNIDGTAYNLNLDNLTIIYRDNGFTSTQDSQLFSISFKELRIENQANDYWDAQDLEIGTLTLLDDQMTIDGGRIGELHVASPTTLAIDEVNINNANIDGTLTVSGDIFINNLSLNAGATINLDDGVSIEVSALTGGGESGDNTVIASTGTANIFLVDYEADLDYMDIDDVNMVGTAFVGTNSTVDNAQGWIEQDKPTANKEKTFFYKAFAADGSYIGKADNITNSFAYTTEVNSTGTTASIKLQSNPFDFNRAGLFTVGNRIDVYVIDKQSTQGVKIFTGQVYQHKAAANTDEVEVTLRSFGYNLGKIVYEASDTLEVFQDVEYTPTGILSLTSYENPTFTTPTRTNKYVFEFTTDSDQTDLSAIAVSGRSGYDITLKIDIYESKANAQAETSSLGQSTTPAKSPVIKDLKFTFDTPIAVTSSTKYYATLQFASGVNEASIIQGTANPSEASYYTFDSGWVDTLKKAYYKIYSSRNDTEVTKSGDDVADVLKDIIDSQSDQGGVIVYDDFSIPTTGVEVNYTFKNNTCLEAIEETVSQLGDFDYYYYIDPKDNKFYLRQFDTSNIDHTIKSNMVENIDWGYDIADLTNTIYFIGKEDAGVRFFKKYADATSVSRFGTHADIIQDGRVTQDATAQNKSQFVFDNKAGEVLAMAVSVIDNSSQEEKGYDIETLGLGDVVDVRAVEDLSTNVWNVGEWTESPGVTDKNTLYWSDETNNFLYEPLLVRGISYSSDILKLRLGTLKPNAFAKQRTIRHEVKDLFNDTTPTEPS